MNYRQAVGQFGQSKASNHQQRQPNEALPAFRASARSHVLTSEIERPGRSCAPPPNDAATTRAPRFVPSSLATSNLMPSCFGNFQRLFTGVTPHQHMRLVRYAHACCTASANCCTCTLPRSLAEIIRRAGRYHNVSTARTSLLPLRRLAPSYPPRYSSLRRGLQNGAVKDDIGRFAIAPLRHAQDLSQVIRSPSPERRQLRVSAPSLVNSMPGRQVVRHYREGAATVAM